ncbi:hypothetical protein ERUR111494_00080 [Erysipelothrix urinaevulpis]|uniref:hypothetical protein n=1 Tax=Erysipelothrix urinaevulpis TaxID=2683717 RepID=UPI00135A3C09|nr:hypothetical protein [Erysipelothrix urinaevulpis]
MNKSKFLYRSISLLSLIILLISLFLIIQKEYILAIPLIVLALFSMMLVLLFSRKDKENENELETTFEVDESSIQNETESHDDFIDQLNFVLPIHDGFNDKIMLYIKDTIDENMFLESLEYRFSDEKLIESGLVGIEHYKYQFHPIPLVSFSKDHKNKSIIKVKIGMRHNSMIHVGYVPQMYVDDVNRQYKQIKNIKATLSGGNYRIKPSIDKNIREYVDPFSLNLTIYFQ